MKNERNFKGHGEKNEKPIKICVKIRTFFFNGVTVVKKIIEIIF